MPIVTPNWTSSFRTTSTAATVEVDIMPHLARVPEGGSFGGYATALHDLGAAYVRFSPWYLYPRVAVAELTKTDCSAHGSTWNSTLLDQVVSDFMTTVCGPEAADGVCHNNRSVVPQLSTMPDWLYESDGVNRTAKMPADPWQYPTDDMGYYIVPRKPLRDPTCKEMARYAARYVGWYTAGGFTDECGVRHTSNLHYDWPLLSVLNEDEYGTPPGGGVVYTTCWDAWKAEIAKVNKKMRLVGPETAGGSDGVRGRRRGGAASLGGQLDYSLYFLDPANHADGEAPPVVSNHVALYGPPWRQFFSGVDRWVAHVATPLGAARDAKAPSTELVMNEFIPFNNEWCGSDACDWQSPSAANTSIDRTTLGWSAAAASWAYAFGRLGERGWTYVGADQLIGGVWPDNEPAVASLDWQTGEPNAKYYAIRMLATALGAGAKRLYNVSVGAGPPPPYAPGETHSGNCGSTDYGGDCTYDASGAWVADQENITSLALCAARCRTCARCNYVSYSNASANNDCSWYSHCTLRDPPLPLPQYESEAVRPANDTAAPLYAVGIDVVDGGARYVLLVSQTDAAQNITLRGGGGALIYVLEGVGAEPGFNPPAGRRLSDAGEGELGPFAVALVALSAAAEVKLGALLAR